MFSDIKSLANIIQPAEGIEVEQLPDDYDIEHLDYGYVRACQDTRELKKLLQVLKSGEHGYYPELEQAILTRLSILDPSIPLPLNANESYLLHRQDWKVKEQKAKFYSTAPIRNSTQGNVVVAETKTAAEKEHLAALEKTKGNEALRVNELEEALIYYQRSIDHLPTASVYHNRSLVYSKLKEWESSETEATLALGLDPNHVKSFYRRGVARFHMKRYLAAMSDFDQVIALDADNQDAKEWQKKTRENFIEQQPQAERILSDEPIHTTRLSISAPSVSTTLKIDEVDVDSDDDE